MSLVHSDFTNFAQIWLSQIQFLNLLITVCNMNATSYRKAKEMWFYFTYNISSIINPFNYEEENRYLARESQFLRESF